MLIQILGPEDLQNNFLKYILSKELGAECIIFPDHSFLENEENKKVNTDLLLIDSSAYSFEMMVKDIVTNPSIEMDNTRMALFNMTKDTRVEEKALARGIMGFFYKDDKIELFLKGIDCIFKGEIWISRSILLGYVLNNMKEKKSKVLKDHDLTKREMEILQLLGLGANNNEIAEKMFISPHTVKTHLYNIFKKIGVTSRLHAVIWANENL